MSSKRTKILITLGAVLLFSLLAMAGFGQGEEFQKAASTGVVTYHVVTVPGTMTAAQLQATLTAQGNMGFHFIGPFAVGTGPIPTGEVFVFSKP
jgi:molecular chaperone DnaK (HSP70)